MFHSCIDSSTHYFTYYIHWFHDAWVHWSSGSSTHHLHSLIHWLDWFTDSLYILRSCNAPLHHGFVDALIHWIIDDRWLINSHWRIDSSIHSFIDSLIQWFIRSVVRGFSHVISSASQPAFAHSLMHLTTWSIRCSCIAQTFLLAIDFLYIVISYFRNFRLGRVPGTIWYTTSWAISWNNVGFPRPDWD